MHEWTNCVPTQCSACNRCFKGANVPHCTYGGPYHYVDLSEAGARESYESEAMELRGRLYK